MKKPKTEEIFETFILYSLQNLYLNIYIYIAANNNVFVYLFMFEDSAFLYLFCLRFGVFCSKVF